ncbi:MAG: lactate utilization protein C [Puniceicoccaceae bacterium]
MSNDRDTIFASIKSALEPLPERTECPDWADILPVSKKMDTSVSTKELFVRQHVAASGRACSSVDELIQLLKDEDCSFGYCDPELANLIPEDAGIQFDTDYDMAKVDEYKFGITKASTAIAESGTIVLKDGETSARLAALAPWIHIAVLSEVDIVSTHLEAIQQMADDPYIVFSTGPSKTADIEGILIEGVHGPGIQVALLL